MKAARGVVVVVVVAACSTGDPAAPRVGAEPTPRDFGSGSRLSARVHRVGGVIDVLRGFYDAELGLPCAFEELGRANVGPGPSYYCFPIGSALHTEGLGPYADAGCSVPMAIPPPDEEASFAIVEPRDACASRPRVFRAGARANRRPYVRDGARCARASSATIVQSLDEEVPIEAFATARERVDQTGGRVASLIIASPDGAWQALAGYDLARGEAVRRGTAGDGVPRWVPSRVAFRGASEPLFAGLACEAPVATKNTRDAICPLTSILEFQGACGDGRFYALGAPADTRALRRRADDGACAPSAPGDVFAFALGAPIPASAFEPVRTSDVGVARVRRRALFGDGGSAALLGDLLDVETGEPCEVARAHDGSLRCLPASSAQVTLFADDACSLPAFAKAGGSCERATPRFVRGDLGDGAHVYEVTGALPVVYTAERGRCELFTAEIAFVGFGAREIEPSRFAEVVEADDPGAP